MSKYSFCCNNGCGVVGVQLVAFETHREETVDGELISSTTVPEIVCNRCGGGVEVWDDTKDDIVAEVRVVGLNAIQNIDDAIREALVTSSTIDVLSLLIGSLLV